jgi:hypothetical protein
MNSYLTNFNDTNWPPTPPGSQLRENGSSLSFLATLLLTFSHNHVD